MPHDERCRKCYGSGYIREHIWRRGYENKMCNECLGKGTITVQDQEDWDNAAKGIVSIFGFVYRQIIRICACGYSKEKKD